MFLLPVREVENWDAQEATKRVAAMEVKPDAVAGICDVDDEGNYFVVKSALHALGADSPVAQLYNREANLGMTWDPNTAVKSFGHNRVGGYGILWGDQSRKDLDNTYFDKNDTHDLLSVFKAMGGIPWLFHHGADDMLVKSTVVGVVDDMGVDDTGLWYEARIREHELYERSVAQLVAAGKLYSSSGTLPAAMRYNKSTGLITRWPIVEMSGTHTPAEHRMLTNGTVSEVKSLFEQVTDKPFKAKVLLAEGVAETLERQVRLKRAQINQLGVR